MSDRAGPALRKTGLAANGLRFDCLEIGSGPLVLLLHGFPDHPRSWAGIMARFAAAGYRAVAPVMRGYAPDTRAPDGCYRDWATGSDAIALIEALGSESAVLIGHDWGASAAYAAARIAPHRLEALITLAVPFGRPLRHALIVDGDQQRRSWYWYFFQLPFAADAVAHDDFAFLARLWAEWSPGYRLPAEYWAVLKASFAVPGVLDETLAYYRQLFAPGPVPTPPAITARLAQPIAVPTLYLHGRQDGCIGVDLGDAVDRALFVGGYQRKIVEEAGHFLHLERPDEVFAAMRDFLEIRSARR